jgi:hypothetical protein
VNQLSLLLSGVRFLPGLFRCRAFALLHFLFCNASFLFGKLAVAIPIEAFQNLFSLLRIQAGSLSLLLTLLRSLAGLELLALLWLSLLLALAGLELLTLLRLNLLLAGLNLLLRALALLELLRLPLGSGLLSILPALRSGAALLKLLALHALLLLIGSLITELPVLLVDLTAAGRAGLLPILSRFLLLATLALCFCDSCSGDESREYCYCFNTCFHCAASCELLPHTAV